MDDRDVAAIVRDGYDQIAQRYTDAVARSRVGDPRDEWTQRLLQRLAPNSSVLDIGCGSGIPTAAVLADGGHHVVGVDISPRQIESARRNVPSGAFVVGDITELDAEPASFDAVVALFSLTHVPRERYPMLFDRIVDWMHPGAWLLASMGTSDVAGFDEVDFLGFGHPNWTNGYDAATTRGLLEAAGFVLEHSEIVADESPFGPERWHWVLGRRGSSS